MKVIVISATGHIGTYLIPMLVEAGHETIAITRSNSQPYEDHPAWSKAQRLLMDRAQPDFLQELKAMEPDVIVNKH